MLGPSERIAIVAPKCEPASSQNSTTCGCRSSAAWTLARCTPRPRPWTRRTSRRPAAAAASRYSLTTEGMSAGAKLWRSISSSIGTLGTLGTLTGSSSGTILRRDDRLEPAADRKVADDGHAPRPQRGHQVVEDLVGHVLVENAAVA